MKLICFWKDCVFTTDIESLLASHFAQHINSFILTYNTKESFCPLCLEYMVTPTDVFDGTIGDLLERHFSYHLHQIVLLCKGLKYHMDLKFSLCDYKVERKCSLFKLPFFSSFFVCLWLNCNFKTNDINTYFHHCNEHGKENVVKVGKCRGNTVCLWIDCNKVFNKASNFKTHMMTHTTEKYILCPHCGLSLSSLQMFRYHFLRQNSSLQEKTVEAKPVFQCLICSSVYATKEILTIHVKNHVKCLKCHHCNYSSYNFTSLRRHYQCRHTSQGIFKCEYCQKRYKTFTILRLHQIKCIERQSQAYTVSSRSAFTDSISSSACLTPATHPPKIYQCHLCDLASDCRRRLNYHIRKHHKLRAKQRMQFRMCEDGKYRLSTMRLNSLHAVSAILNEPD